MEGVSIQNGRRFHTKRSPFCHKTQPGIDDCPRSQHYVCRRTQENEGDANKNYFVSLGSVAWLSQELIFFTRSALPLGSSKNFTAFFLSSYLIFGGITLVDEVHDFVDFLVGEVFVPNEWAVDERAVARVGQSADDAATLQPVPCVLEELADAGPEDGGDADVDNCGDEQDDGYPE